MALGYLPQSRTAFLSQTTERLLAMLPPFEQQSVDIQAALDACAMELDRLDTRLIEVRDAFFPQRAEEYLLLWEAFLGLPVAPPDKTLEQRQVTVLSFMQAWATAATGIGWQEALNNLIGTGWSYREHDPGDPSSPDQGVIEISLPYSVALAEPTGLTATSSGSGTLGAGTYTYVVTARNFYGETLPSAQDDATVGASGRIVLDWGDVAGATHYWVYRKGPSAGPFKFLTSVTNSDFIDTGAIAPGTIEPPLLNTTESFRAGEARELARRVTPAHLELQFEFGDAFVVGISQLGFDTL